MANATRRSMKIRWLSIEFALIPLWLFQQKNFAGFSVFDIQQHIAEAV